LLPKGAYDIDRTLSFDEPGDSKGKYFVWEDFLSPFIGSLVLLPFAVAFVGVIIASNPALEPHTPKLLSTVIMSQALGTLWFAGLSQYCTCTNIDLLSAAYLAQMGVALHRDYYYYYFDREKDGLDEGETLFVQLVVAQALFTFVVGSSLCLLARLDGVWYLRFFPYPVACGFVSGIGFLILDGGLELGASCGMKELAVGFGTFPMRVYAHAGLTVLVGAFFVSLRRCIHNATRLPIALLVTTVAVHLGGAALGLSEADLDAKGMFLKGLEAEPWTSSWSAMADGVAKAHLTGLLGQNCLTLTVSYALLHMMVYPFYAIGMQDIDTPADKFDVKREITQLGRLNMGLGLLGGVPSCHSYKVCIVMKDSGAKTRTWVFLLGIAFLGLYFDTSLRPTIRLVPKCAFGGLVFSLGYEFLSASLLESRQRVANTEWRLVLATAMMTYFNVLLGLVFGGLLTMGLFVVEYSGMTGIVQQATFAEVRSLLKRPKEETDLLSKHGAECVIFWCAGYIFFGTAATIVEEIEEYLDANPATRYMIIDFEGVPAVDASGVHSLTEFAARCGKRKKHVRVCFCGLVRRLNLALKNVIASKAIRDGPRLYSRRVEQALEWAEDEVLRRAKSKLHTFPAERTMSRQTSADAEGVDVQAILRNMLEHLSHEAQQEEVKSAAQMLSPCTQLLSFRAKPKDSHHSWAADANAGVIFLEGACAYDLLYVVAGNAELRRSLEGETSLKLPRHHLNTEKGDQFVFEERTEVRVERVSEGGVLGLVEFAAAYGLDTVSVSDRPKRTATAVAAPKCQALRVPFHELHDVLGKHPGLGREVLAKLGKLIAVQALELTKTTNVKPYRNATADQQASSEASAAGSERNDAEAA